jgi:dTDP-4-amino-4,6-dideoxygalactose transaminase
MNYRMTDVQAAIGRRQLERLPQLVARRRGLAQRYAQHLKGVTAPHEPSFARSNWQSYCVRLRDGLDQPSIMQALLDRGIATRRGIMCAHLEPPYAETMHSPLIQSEQARDRCVLLPIYAQMTDAEQDTVVAAVNEACG